MQHLKFIDLFSGIGGFRLGMERAGNRCVGWADIDKYACQSYMSMYPHSRKEWHAEEFGGDVSKVSDKAWKQLDKKVGHINVVCGGFPCQTFSIAGERKGFLDRTRGTLCFQVMRCARDIKPEYIFLENVKGILNHDHGRTFRIILATLNSIGYSVEYHLMNSKYFGVPQNRERVYIIAHRRGARTADVFDKADCSADDPEAVMQVSPLLCNQMVAHAQPMPDGKDSTKIALMHRGKHQSKNVYYDDGISPTVDATTYKHKILVGNRIHLAHQSRRELCRLYYPDGVSPTISTMQGGERQPKIVQDLKDKNKLSYYHNTKKFDYRIYDDKGIMRALSATDYKHIPNVHVKRVYDARKHGKYSIYDVYSPKGQSPTLQTMQGGDRQPKIALKVKEATKKGYAIAKPGDSVNLSYPKSKTRRGRVGHQIANTVTASNTNGGEEAVVLARKGKQVAVPCLTPFRVDKRQNGRRFKNNEDPEFTLNTIDRNGVGVTHNGKFAVRKLTPCECWRLQGYPDVLFKRAQAVCSNSQLYKQAGNSVSVPVIEWIASRLAIKN